MSFKTMYDFNCYWCQNVLPLIYTDSLSYYEMLCKLGKAVEYISNEIITIEGDIKNLQNQINELKIYIDTQLKNYTEEQLEKWLDDGTLETLILNLSNNIYINVLNPPFNLTPLNNTGNVDNTSNLNTILSYLSENNIRGTLYFPKGTYLIVGTINITSNSIRILGENLASTRFTTNSNTSMFKVSNDSTLSYITFENISADNMATTVSSESIFAECSNCSYIFFNYCTLYNFSTFLLLDNCAGTKIFSVYMGDNTDAGVVNVTGIKIINNFNSSKIYRLTTDFNNSTGNVYGIYSNDKVQDILIDTFESTGCTTAVYLSNNTTNNPGNIVITNSTFESVKGYAILFENINANYNNRCMVTNCYFSPGLTNATIIRINQCYNISISGNNFYNTLLSDLSNYGVNIVSSRRINIINNGFVNMIRAVVASNSFYCNISENNFYNGISSYPMLYGVLFDVCQNNNIVNNMFSGFCTNFISMTNGSINNIISLNNGNVQGEGTVTIPDQNMNVNNTFISTQ